MTECLNNIEWSRIADLQLIESTIFDIGSYKETELKYMNYMTFEFAGIDVSRRNSKVFIWDVVPTNENREFETRDEWIVDFIYSREEIEELASSIAKTFSNWVSNSRYKAVLNFTIYNELDEDEFVLSEERLQKGVNV